MTTASDQAIRRMTVTEKDVKVEQEVSPERMAELKRRLDALTAGGGSMAVAEPVATDAPVGAAWSGVIAQEGVDTGDGRIIQPDAINWRELPLPLMAQLSSDHGGGDSGPAVVAGRIENIERVGEDIIATGVFDTGASGMEAQRLVSDGMLRGISIDLAVNEAEFIPDGEPSGDVIEDMFMPGTLSILDGTILGATIVPFPAFENASIAITAGAAMRLAWARKQDGRTVVSFNMPFAPAAPPAPAAPAAPAGGGQARLDSAMTTLEDAVQGMRDAVDAMGGSE